LPKTKIVRIKAKKKVKAEEDAAPGAEGAAVSAKSGSAVGGKPADTKAAAKPAAGAARK